MTTVVNTVTGEIVEATYADVKHSVEKAKASLEQAAEQIVWQIEHQAWTVLGYSDWNAMREGEYGGAAFMVPRAERPELVARMRQSGLTQQEIADTAGISRRTVADDLLNADSPIETVTNSRGQQRPATYTPRPAPTPTAATVEQAVEEFPDLQHYVEVGRANDATRMADDLRRFRERGELDDRLDTLRRSIAVDKAKRDGTYRSDTTAVMGEDGTYRMEPLPAKPTTRTCPTCSGRGLIEE